MPNKPNDLDLADIVVRRKGDIVVAAIPQFGLVAQGETLQATLDALELKKDTIRADLATFAAFKPDSTTVQLGFHTIGWGGIAHFAIKAVIVFCLSITAIFYISIRTKDSIDSAFYRMQANLQNVVANTHDFWPRLEKELERAAGPDRELSPERKQKLLSNIRIIVDRWRPFVVEASAIFAAKNPPPADETRGVGNPPAAR